MVNPTRVLNDKMSCNHSLHWLKQVTGHLLASRGRRGTAALCAGEAAIHRVLAQALLAASVGLPMFIFQVEFPHTLTVGETETLFERGLCEPIYEDLSGSFSILKIVK